MFKTFRKTKQQVEQFGVYIQGTVEHVEQNKDLYKAAAIGFGVGTGVVLLFRSRPVVINNTILTCGH